MLPTVNRLAIISALTALICVVSYFVTPLVFSGSGERRPGDFGGPAGARSDIAWQDMDGDQGVSWGGLEGGGRPGHDRGAGGGLVGLLKNTAIFALITLVVAGLRRLPSRRQPGWEAGA